MTRMTWRMLKMIDKRDLPMPPVYDVSTYQTRHRSHFKLIDNV